MISIGKLTSVEQAVRYLREAVAQRQIEYYTARNRQQTVTFQTHGAN